MLIYDEDGLNTIFNDPTFLSNYDVYKKDNIDKNRKFNKFFK